MKRVLFTDDPPFRPVQVLWFASRRAFLRYYRTKRLDGRRLSGRDAGAACLTFPEEAVVDGHPFAELLFYDGQFTAGNIAHEVGHAVMEMFDRGGLDPVADQEVFCTLLGSLTQWVTDWKDATTDA